MFDVKETSKTARLKHGHVQVGTTAVRITDTKSRLERGLMLRTPGPTDPVPNTAPIWIGREAVTADSDDGTGGLPLLPGVCIVLPVEDPSELWAVSTSANQDLAWVGV